MANEIAVRPGKAGDRVAIENVLDGANLALDSERLTASLERGACYVAVSGAGTVVGALVREGEEVLAVAVRRGRRDQGIGSRLVRAALADCEALVAEFDPRVRRFWESLGFEVEAIGETQRLRGRVESES